jgi:hypothetical protein
MRQQFYVNFAWGTVKRRTSDKQLLRILTIFKEICSTELLQIILPCEKIITMLIRRTMS